MEYINTIQMSRKSDEQMGIYMTSGFIEITMAGEYGSVQPPTATHSHPMPAS